MKDRMAKLRSMRGKKTVKRGGQFGEIAIPAAAIALGSMAPSILSGAYGAANSAYHYLFDKKTKPVVPTAIVPQQMYTNSRFRGNGITRPNLMHRRGGMLQTPLVSGPLA